jgi:hypothetical protein
MPICSRLQGGEGGIQADGRVLRRKVVEYETLQAKIGALKAKMNSTKGGTR